MDSLHTRGHRNIKKLMKKFNTSGFNGKKVIQCSPQLILKFFWFVVYSAGVVMTALTCFYLYLDYIQEPIALNVIPVRNETISLPDATLCLPTYHADEIVDLYLDGEPISSHVESFFTKYSSWEEMGQATWTTPLLYLVQNYLHFIFETETLQRDYQHQPLQEMLNKEDNITEAIVDVLLPKMVAWNVTLTDLIEKFAEKFREFFSVKITKQMKNTDTQNDEPLNHIIQGLTFATKYQICYKIAFSELDFNNILGITILMDNKNLIAENPPSPDSSEYSYSYSSSSDYQSQSSYSSFYSWNPFYGSENDANDHLIDSYEPSTIDFSGKLRPGKKTRYMDLAYTVKYRAYTRLVINPRIKHVLMPSVRGKKMCLENSTITQCQAECRNEEMKKRCKCQLSATRSATQMNATNSEITSCLIGQYETCLISFTGTEDANCMNDCLDSCIRFEYDVNTKVEVIKKGYANDPFRIILNMTLQEYMRYEEYYDWTALNMFGMIGGAIDLWIGLDIAVLVYGAISISVSFLLDKVFACCCVDHIKNVEKYLSEKAGESQRYFASSLMFLATNSNSCNILNLMKWTAKKIIWLALLITGVYMAIQMLQEPFDDFKQQRTKFILETMRNAASLPPAAICATTSISATEFLPFGSEMFNATHIEQSIKQLNDEMFAKMKSNESWSPITSAMAYTYAEMVYLRPIAGGYDSYGIYDRPFQESVVNLQLILTEIRVGMANWSITENELLQRVGNELLKRLNITVECYNSRDNTAMQFTPYLFSLEARPDHLPYSSNIAQLGLDSVGCFHFSLEKFAFHNVRDSCTLSALSLAGRATPLNTAVFTNQYFLKFKKYDSHEYEIDALIDDVVGQEIFFSYTKSYQFNNADCSTTYTSPLICEETCRQEMMDAMSVSCSKWPEKNKSTVWTDYVECGRKVADEWKEKCSSRCRLSPCNQAEYEIIQTPNDDLINGNDERVRKGKINFQNFNYLQFTEQLKMTSSDISVAIGGILGFWLGVDIIIAVHALIAPILSIVGFYLKPRNNSNTPPKQQSDEKGRFNSFFRLLKIVDTNADRISYSLVMKALLEKLFWTSIYLTFGILAYRMCIDFYEQAVYSPTKWSVENQQNDSFVFPLVSLCVPYSPHEFEEDPSNANNSEPQSDSQLFNSLNITADLLRNTSESWTNFILFRVIRYYLTLMDSYKVMERKNPNKMWSLLANSSQNSTDIDMAVDHLRLKMDHFNVTNDQLKHKFGQEFLRINHVKLTKYSHVNGTPIDSLIKIEQVAFVSESKVCYTLPRSSIAFNSPQDYMSISVDKRTQKERTYEDYNHCYCEGCQLTVDLLGRDNGVDYDRFILAGGFGNTGTINLKVEEMIRMMPVVSETQRCSESISPEICMEDCRVSAVEQQCNCTPSRYYMNEKVDKIRQEPNCSFEHFLQCMPNISARIASDCIEKCLPSCDYVRYSIERSKDNTGTSKFNHYSAFSYAFTNAWMELGCNAALSLNFAPSQYVVYTEKIAWSDLNFLAALGGILNLWLGFDIIWLVEGCVAIIRWIYLKLRCGRPRVADKGRNSYTTDMIRISFQQDLELQSLPKVS